MDFIELPKQVATPPARPQQAFYHDQGVVPPELNEVYDRITQPNPDHPQVSAEEMIKPYYGADYQKEVLKAGQYTAANFPHKVIKRPRTWWQSLLGQPAGQFVSRQRENVPDGFFSLSKNTEEYRKTNTPIKPVDDFYDQENTGEEIKMQWPDKMSPTNTLLPRQKDDKKQFMSILEHEAGHNTGAGFSLSPYFNNQEHLSKPVELENGLGRINRENFLMSGSRFDSQSLENYMKKQLDSPVEKRFEGFSNEALRVWEVLQQSYEGQDEYVKQLFKDAQVIIPALVQNENKTAKQIFG